MFRFGLSIHHVDIFVQIYKKGAGQRKLKTHVVGAIAHGRNKYFMVDFNDYPHNTVLTVLLNVLMNEALATDCHQFCVSS